MRSRVVILALLALTGVVLGENILFLSGVTSPSHHIYNRAFALGLAAKEHNVTFVSVDDTKKQVPNVHYIFLERGYDAMTGEVGIDIVEYADKPIITSVLELPAFCLHICNSMLLSKGLDVILNYPKDFHFSAVIYDFTFGPCLLPLVARFNNPPLISISGFANPPFTTDLVGGHKYPAYTPHYAVGYTTEMSFFQRAFNTYLYFVDWV